MRSVDFKAIEASAQEFHIWREQVHSTFCALFPNRLDSIVRTLDGTGWRTVSRFYSLSDEDIQESVSRSAKALRAVMSGVSTRFSVLTIAAGSELYSLAGLARIREALERIGIVKTSFYKASGSDDWQIYIWWTESVKAKELEKLFSEWLVEIGLSAGHSLFVFPGPKPLPLPLQPGFAWLDERGAIKVGREELSLEQAVEAFLNDMVTGANRWEVVSHQIKHLTELETVERNVIDAWEPPIDRLMPDSNESSVRVIALIQPTCDNELLTFDTCVPATLQVSVPEVEYTVSFAPDQNEPKNRIAPDASDDRGFDMPVYQRG
jgi:hypothetical protein